MSYIIDCSKSHLKLWVVNVGESLTGKGLRIFQSKVQNKIRFISICLELTRRLLYNVGTNSHEHRDLFY